MNKSHGYIPPECNERFLNFSHGTEGVEWFGNGVAFACISELYTGYFMHRPACGHHVLLYGTGGCGTYRTEDLAGRVEKSTLLFIPAGRLHHYETDNSWNFLGLHINPAISRWKYLKDLPAQCRPARFVDDIAALMEMLYREITRSDRGNQRVLQYYCRLILAYVDMDFQHDLSQSELDCERRLEKVWELAAKDPSRKWTIKELAAQAGMSSPHFYAMTRKHYSKTPMEIIRSQRLALGSQLLQFTAEPLDSIAGRIGYDSQFSFSRAFKRSYKKSPGQFRKRP